MCTTLVVIFLVRVEQMAEMLLAKDHDVIEAVPPDGSAVTLEVARPKRDLIAASACSSLSRPQPEPMDGSGVLRRCRRDEPTNRSSESRRRRES
jgi:hypothetical protein